MNEVTQVQKLAVFRFLCLNWECLYKEAKKGGGAVKGNKIVENTENTGGKKA